MDPLSPLPDGRNRARTGYVLGGLAVLFVALAVLFLGTMSRHVKPNKTIPMVDAKFLATTPWRQTYANLVKAKADLSDYDCYGCHEKKNPPVLRFDEKQNIIVPQEHANIVMGHGSHGRNNVCYNCHNEKDLTTLQARNDQVIGFDNIPQLCGTCHGPTYRDWEAGAHGRTSGYWDRSKGDIVRLSCANCHNPHSPRIPTREPAPGPHALRAVEEPNPHGAAH